MSKIFIPIILFLLIPVTVSATEWYVRPAGGNYGAEDGSSYTNAWDGFDNIDWNSIGPGDNLYVCGLHVVGLDALEINSSGTPGNLVTVRGDCSKINPSYEDGVIWAGFRIGTSEWDGQTGGYWYKDGWWRNTYTVAEGDVGNEVSLMPCGDVNCVQNTDGSFYWNSTISRVYFNPTGTQLKDFWMYSSPYGAVYFNEQDYIAVRNLKLRGSSSNRGVVLIGNTIYDTGDFPDHWEITGNDIAFSPYTGIYSDGDSDYGLIENNTIHDVPTGTYFITRGVGYSDNLIIRGNEVYSGGDRPGVFGLGAGDRQALGGQCGDNQLYEYNYIHDWVGDGINIYMGSGCTAHNVTMRYNRIINLNDVNNQYYHRALQYSCTNTVNTADRTTDWKIHNNIVWNCGGTLVPGDGFNTNGLAVRIKTGVPANPQDKIKIFNNVFGDCNIGLAWIPDVQQDEIGFELKNNIFYQPKTGGWHVYIHNNGDVTDYSNIDMDYNLYYPDAKFSWINSGDTQFTGFVSDAANDGVFIESNAVTQNPLFVNPGNENFHLQPNSPAIDNGTDVGLTIDFEGNPIPQGAGFDIGAFEFLSGFTLLGDLNSDGRVDVLDLGIIALNFGKRNTHPEWNATADVILSNEIDIYDLVFVASRFS